MGILEGKRILVTGVLTDASIAFHVARIAQLEGARVVLTGFGRLSLVERIARRLPEPAPVLELDVTNAEHLASAVHVSTYSLKALARAALPLMEGGGAGGGLDFDASAAWPAYDGRGVA